MRTRMTTTVLGIAVLAAMASYSGCSCTSEFTVTGVGTADEPAVDGRCPHSAGARAAACTNALADADTRAKQQCPKDKPNLVKLGNSDHIIADCARSTTTFPKPGDVCGVSGTATRKYKCCKIDP